MCETDMSSVKIPVLADTLDGVHSASDIRWTPRVLSLHIILSFLTALHI